MIVTEAEAKTKWCPMVRYTCGMEDSGANRFNMGTNPRPEWGAEENPGKCRCIASECMMWRWFDGEMVHFPLACDYGVFCNMAKNVDDEDPAFPCSTLLVCKEWYRRYGDCREVVCKDRRGYCGLTRKAVKS